MTSLTSNDSNDFKKTLIIRMDDIGTREDHCNDLLDIWNAGLAILLARTYANMSERDQDMIKGLTYAIELLKKHMTVVIGPYKESTYKEMIDALPMHAEDIKDE